MFFPSPTLYVVACFFTFLSIKKLFKYQKKPLFRDFAPDLPKVARLLGIRLKVSNLLQCYLRLFNQKVNQATKHPTSVGVTMFWKMYDSIELASFRGWLPLIV